MPNFLFETFFSNRLAEITAKGSVILFNTMTLNQKDNIRNEAFRKSLDPKHYAVRALPRLESHNEVMLLERV